MRLLIFVFFFLFNGCSSYYEILKQDPIKDSTMRFTKKGEIINSLETKGVLVATHLNRVDSNYNDGEYFTIALYISDPFEDRKKRGINDPRFNIYLNGLKPLEIKELQIDDPLVRQMPLNNKWNSYYLLKFEKSQKVVLEFSSILYESIFLEYK